LKHAQHTIRSLAALALALLLLNSAALAAEVQVDRAAVYCFSGADFQSGGSGELTGIYVCSVPSALSCRIRYGARSLRAGDVLPAEALSRLVLSPTSRSAVQSEFVYCPITAEGLGTQQTLKLKILSGKNEPPEAENSALETYKNIANTGTLKASDPEGGPLTYKLVKEPKRGTVTLNADGSFTYTPKQNKVGRDKFVYTATDADGNVSQEATVTVKIVKPTDRARYADMAGDEAEYTAMWLKDEGVYAGRTVAGSLCFEPDSAVTRGEFLVMAMKLLGAEPESAALTSGFADEESTPRLDAALYRGRAQKRRDLRRQLGGRPGLPAGRGAHEGRGRCDAPEHAASAGGGDDQRLLLRGRRGGRARLGGERRQHARGGRHLHAGRHPGRDDLPPRGRRASLFRLAAHAGKIRRRLSRRSVIQSEKPRAVRRGGFSARQKRPAASFDRRVCSLLRA
jgi:hypothetical protein